MKIATWNVNSLHVRLPQVLDWLQRTAVDVLALQELKLPDERFPHDAFASAGYQSACHGQKTYNGVALITRQPLREVARGIPGFDDDSARIIAGTLDTGAGPLRIVDGYFVNGQEPGSDKFAYKMRWLEALGQWLHDEIARHPSLVLLGDFNIVPEDRDSYDPEGLAGTILHTPQERAHFQRLLALGLTDSFRLFDHPDKERFTWWDYRRLAFPKNRGLRIDHILISAPLVPRALACRVDREQRKAERPSDHAPVTLELAD